MNQECVFKTGVAALESLPLPDACLQFAPQFIPAAQADALYEQLRSETAWRSEAITVYGKTWLQPRLLAWYGDADARYQYSGITHDPLPWTPCLLQLRRLVSAVCGESFNSVLLNFYRNERDSMGLHADNEPELGPQPVIASLSLGAQRRIVFRHRSRRDVPNLNLVLPHGSLLVMSGGTQACWLHGIRKQQRACGGRINLTFRRVLVG